MVLPKAGDHPGIHCPALLTDRRRACHPRIASGGFQDEIVIGRDILVKKRAHELAPAPQIAADGSVRGLQKPQAPEYPMLMSRLCLRLTL